MEGNKPLILVTNDDGITAPGIRALIAVAAQYGNLLIVAPDKPQSGMGHAITVDSTLHLNELEVDGHKAYSCSGTPVDCVKIAMDKLISGKPDLIVSGINHGSNSSVNVIYSGTMSAAMEGAIENIPAIGFSLCDHSIDANFKAAQHYSGKLIEWVLRNKMPEHTCLNVNFPKVALELLNGIKVCRQADAYWKEEFDERQNPGGKTYYWLTGSFVNRDKGEDTDEWALANNYVSVVPVHYDVTAHAAIAKLKGIEAQ
jgi:5'-nucleotidase